MLISVEIAKLQKLGDISKFPYGALKPVEYVKPNCTHYNFNFTVESLNLNM